MKIPQYLFKPYPIIAVYLFGSRAKEAATPLSDYDFGIQLATSVPSSQYLRLRERFIGLLAQVLKSGNIDVTILNEAPLLLKHEILRTGKLIYVGRPAERARFTFEVIRHFLDWRYYEDRLATSLIYHTAKKGLYG